MFKLQNYNEFKQELRWHDYVNVMINEFAILLVRKYEWYDCERYTFVVQVLGFKVYQKIGDM
jgi:hypothetical protein